MAPKRTIIIGDVHGMTAELLALLGAVALTRDDQLVFVGDLVDKGPDSAGTVRLASDLRDAGYDVRLVLGNHEDKHASYRKAFAAAGERAVANIHGHEEIGEIIAALSPKEIAFLDSATPFLEIPEHGAVVIHGGVTADMESLDASNKGIVSRLLRTRHVRGKPLVKITVELDLDFDPEDASLMDILTCGHGDPVPHKVIRKHVRPVGSFVALEQETPADPFWADVYDGRFGHVFFGHHPFIGKEEPVVFPHATGLDLGAVFGGRLAAAVLEVGRPTTFVSVPSSGKFCTHLWEKK